MAEADRYSCQINRHAKREFAVLDLEISRFCDTHVISLPWHFTIRYITNELTDPVH